MGIYRGAGGSGDATADASSEASLIKVLAVEVQADADAAQASAISADASATAAATSATNAANSATAAAGSASSASSSASSATSSASAASTSATNAASSATAAQTAETNAETAETNATASASLAQEWAIKTTGAVSGGEYSSKYHAQQSASSASSASTSASNAATSATNASNSASAAATSATNAASSATSASGSASTATTQATNASNSATAAASSATSAAGSATTATTQAGIATTQATNAASSASAASTSATNASNSASSAATSASTATTQATNAATSATNAANSATAAANSATAAANSATAAAASAASINPASIAITGGAIDGTTVGATTASSGRFTSLSDSGNLAFTGTGNRITGDFSNATTANKVAFKTSTVDGTTVVTAIPNGASKSSWYAAYTGETANESFVAINVNGTTGIAGIYSSVTGTGTQLPLAMYTGGSERLRIDTSGNVGIGTSSPAANTRLHVSGETPVIRLESTATATNGSCYSILKSNSGAGGTFFRALLGENISGGFDWGIGNFNTTAQTLAFYSGGLVERMRIDSSGNVLIGTSTSASGQTLKLVVSQTAGGGIQLNNVNSTAGGAINTTGGSGLVFYGYTGAIGSETYTERMRIDASGNVCFSCTGLSTSSAPNTSSSSVIEVGSGILKTRGDGQPTRIQFYWGTTQVGSVIVSSTATSYVTSSDYRLKEDIAPMTGALDKVQQLKPVTYKWKADGSASQGFIAHELQAVVPECVVGTKDAVDAEGNPKYQGIDTSFLVATLTAAIQEQQVMIEELKAKVAALEAA